MRRDASAQKGIGTEHGRGRLALFPTRSYRPFRFAMAQPLSK